MCSKRELKGYILITRTAFSSTKRSNLHLSTLDEERAVITQLRYGTWPPAETFMMRQQDQSRYIENPFYVLSG
jgi:hypothetical protein